MSSKLISVVIVERQPMMLVALSSALSATGMNVLAEVKDTGKTVQIIKTLTPDLILYSVGEPDLEDFQTISVLRQEIPLALILALVDSESHEKIDVVKEYGAHMALTKAAPRLELLGAIGHLCKIRKDSE
jgi:DNA-binding NarL/FixJ family response regulator